MSAVLRFAEQIGAKLSSEIAADIGESEDLMDAMNAVSRGLFVAFDGTKGKVTKAVADGMAVELALAIALGLERYDGHKKPSWISPISGGQ